MQKLAKEHKCVRCGGNHKVSTCKEGKPKLERCAFLLGRVFTGVLVNAPGFVCADCTMFEPVIYEADDDRQDGAARIQDAADASQEASAAAIPASANIFASLRSPSSSEGVSHRPPCGSSLRFCGFVNRTRRSRFFGAVCVCSVLRVAVSSVGSDAASS